MVLEEFIHPTFILYTIQVFFVSSIRVNWVSVSFTDTNTKSTVHCVRICAFWPTVTDYSTGKKRVSLKKIKMFAHKSNVKTHPSIRLCIFYDFFHYFNPFDTLQRPHSFVKWMIVERQHQQNCSLYQIYIPHWLEFDRDIFSTELILFILFPLRIFVLLSIQFAHHHFRFIHLTWRCTCCCYQFYL